MFSRMGKKLHAAVRRKAKKQDTFLFQVIGLVTALLNVLGFAIKIVGWPVMRFCSAFHRYLNREMKVHPQLRFLTSHAFVCVVCGLIILTITFLLEHLSTHTLWGVAIETGRAAGVCPLWETISARLVRASEL